MHWLWLPSKNNNSKEQPTKKNNIFSFPMDLDVKCKATLLGALFLIDYMFFEKKGNQESDGFGV